jgi:hypothetical protein
LRRASQKKRRTSCWEGANMGPLSAGARPRAGRVVTAAA